MDYNFKKGDRLLVELLDGQIFEGDCVKCAKDRIDLINPMEYPNGQTLKDVLSYYRLQIASVHVLNCDSEENCDVALTNGTSTECSSPVRTIKLREAEYDRLKKMTREYTYMATMDSRYLNAVDHLSNCESVGLKAIGSELGRMQPIVLLIMCSWDCIYLFDMLLYDRIKFPPDLKALIESPDVKKVVHDSRNLTDCLWHLYKVKLKNVFDTCIADVALQKRETQSLPKRSRTLAQCLTHYLNFPASFLEKAMEITSKEWEDRPLTDSIKIKASQMVAYLIKLKICQEDLMLKDFRGAVDVYSTMTVTLDGFRAGRNLNSSEVPQQVCDALSNF